MSPVYGPVAEADKRRTRAESFSPTLPKRSPKCLPHPRGKGTMGGERNRDCGSRDTGMRRRAMVSPDAKRRAI